MADEIYDILVIGAGPAGTAAALSARSADASVCVIDRESFPRPRTCGGWLGPEGVALSESLGVSARAVGASPFRNLMLHSWDLRSEIAVEDQCLHGWTIERSAFDQALLTAAEKAGARPMLGAAPESITFGEQHVTAHMPDGVEVSGRILLIGDGRLSQTAAAAQLPSAGRSPDAARWVSAEFACREKTARLDVVIGASRIGRLGTIVRTPSGGRVSLTTRETEPHPREQFATLVRAAIEKGLVPAVDKFEQPAEGATPAGVALDMDVHVGKRCLLIGDAGGFVSAFSNEGIYPAMRSGKIAADVALAALGAPVVQDALADYGPAWRSELADYLRMPNTDLGLLMPLVFKNEQMSLRVAKAFLLGQPF